jgi:hypothetical protein
MARQFFNAQSKTTTPGPSFSPAQMAPIQDFLSHQFPLISANHGMPDFNGAWAEIQRTQGAPGSSQTTFSSAPWASEFNSTAFVPGPAVQQSLTPTNSAFLLKCFSKTRSDGTISGEKSISGRKFLHHNDKPLRS